MSTSQTPPSAEETAMTQALASDRPTIDAAIKSYISLVCARNLTASTTDSNGGGTLLGIVKENPTDTSSTQQNVLAFARILLSTANAYNFPIHQTVATSFADKPGTTAQQKEQLLELSIVAQIWNGLIQSQQKPSKYLGRRSLKQAWKGLELESKLQGDAQKLLWLREFEKLLFYQADDAANENQDNDAALLWDADGGTAELARRQKRRQQAANIRKSEPAAAIESDTPKIEEVYESS